MYWVQREMDDLDTNIEWQVWEEVEEGFQLKCL